jgi:hydrogenase-4 component F
MIGIYLFIAFIISGTLFFNRNTILNNTLIIAFLLLQIIFTVYEYYHLNIIELQYFKPDALGILLLATLSIVAIPALYHSYVYISSHNENPRSRGIYYSAMVMLITAIGAAYLSNHIAVTWIFVEITTLSASALIYHHRNERSLEGTWKYVFICAISVTFIFIGILFLSMAMRQAGSTDLTFATLLNKAPILNLFWLRLSFLFIFTGFTAKLGLVPMYTAGIDAKDKAPAPAGALFATVLMNMGFVGIFRIYVVIAHTPIHQWANTVIMIAAFLSVFVATVYMVKVKNIKRMLAYSGIEHMGLVMLGLAAGGIGYYAAILHIILHAFVKSSLFFQFNQIYKIYQSKSVYDVGNYFKYNLTGAMVLLFGFICATAMPPSGLFISEFMIFSSLFQAHQLIILILVMVLLTMIIWAFGKTIFKILFTTVEDFDDSYVVRINPIQSLSQFILLGLSIYLGLNPPAEFVALIHEAIKNLPQ